MIFGKILLFLVSIGEWIASFLPQHTPIGFPDTQVFLAAVRTIAILDRFVAVDTIFITIVIIMTFESAALIYSVYRILMGLFPAMK
jgi:hypothetical protein